MYLKKNISLILFIIIVILFIYPNDKLNYNKILKVTSKRKSNAAKVSLLMSKEAFPDININNYSRKIKKMVREIKKKGNKKKDPLYKIGIINDYLYKNQGFKYDFKDMNARNTKNQFITGYLDSKEGSCITMPLLYYIIGKELNLPLYWVKAPDHFFVRYKNDDGTYINIETTSGGKIAPDESYIKDFEISQNEIKKGIYLKSLNEDECIGDLLCVLGAYYARERKISKAINVFELSLKVYPDNPFAYKFLSMIYRYNKEEKKSNEYLEKAKTLGLQ